MIYGFRCRMWSIKYFCDFSDFYSSPTTHQHLLALEQS